MDLETKVNISMNVISSIASLIVIFLISFISFYDKRLMDRVSLRFTLAISIVDLLKAVLILIYIFISADGAACIAVAFLIPFFTHLYMFLTMCIAFNLQLIFLYGLRFSTKWERWYWFLSVSAAFIICLIPLVMNRLGFDNDQGFCYYKNSLSLTTQIYMWTTYHVWIFLGCIYCTLIVILVIVHLNKKVTIINRICEPEYYTNDKGKRVNINDKVQKNLKRLIRRISLYCLIPIVTQLGFCFSQIYFYYHPETDLTSTVFNWWSFVGTDLPGLLNLFAFLMDPALYAAWRRMNDIRSSAGTQSSKTMKASNPQDEIEKATSIPLPLGSPPPPPVPPKDQKFVIEEEDVTTKEAPEIKLSSNNPNMEQSLPNTAHYPTDLNLSLQTIPEIEISFSKPLQQDSTFATLSPSSSIPSPPPAPNSPMTILSTTPLKDPWVVEEGFHMNDDGLVEMDSFSTEDRSQIFHEANSYITLNEFVRGL